MPGLADDALEGAGQENTAQENTAQENTVQEKNRFGGFKIFQSSSQPLRT